MAIDIRTTSRLNFARFITLDGVEHWELPEYPSIEEATDDLRYVVDANDRIDRMSQAFYGTPDLWWIIALANDLVLVPDDLYPGQVLRIPSGRRVFTSILRKASRGRVGR